MSTTIYFSETENERNQALKNIQPGDIVLFSATGKHRPLRIQDRFLMLGQAIFKKEYRRGLHRANAGITHVAVCVDKDSYGWPQIAEINRGGASIHYLTYSFYHTTLNGLATYKYRPLHIFRPTNEAFRDAFVQKAKEGEALHEAGIRNQKSGFSWNLWKAMRSLTKRRHTQGKKYFSQESKPHIEKTQCAEFAVRSMKQGAKQANTQDFYPKIPSNVSPSYLLSYLLDKVEGEQPLFTHHVHLDIHPYKGLQAVIREQIGRLRAIRKDGATEKADAIETALTAAELKIANQSPQGNALEQAQELFSEISKTLEKKRTNYNPFKRSTAFLSARDYLEDAQRYTIRLR